MFDKLLDNLKASRKTIVFTEGTDARILDAAARLLSEGLMDVILCGNPAEVKAAAPADSDENPDYTAIRSFLSGLLDRMGVNADIDIGPRANGGINVNLTGSAMGAIIGRRGETLDAIQHLTNYVVNKDSEKHLHVSVDAEAYRSKREESLTHLAEKMAEKAIKYKRSMALEPMNSYERHVIHTALQSYEGVTTSSTGAEPNRRVVVSYVKPEQPDNKPQSREWA
jgi:spoIIIJ-associated protein